MLRSSIALPALLAFAFVLLAPIESTKLPKASDIVPLPPAAGKTVAEVATTSPAAAAVAAAPATSAPDYPLRLTIPSISLSSRVVPVGLTDSGAMDVPNGSTHAVGWYKFGTVPGQIGSAVIDAHVFAAFADLNKVKKGSDIYIETSTHQKLHFKVTDTELYKFADVPADILFNRADERRLNLITCAGKLTLDHSTYDHRLVVYTTLVD